MGDYPLCLVYCGVCGMPPEYCEFGPTRAKCRAWAEEAAPPGGSSGSGDFTDEEEEAKKGGGRKRGGRGQPRRVRVPPQRRVTVYRVARAKRKSVTVVSGLGLFGVDLKLASKQLGTKYACGSSVTGPDQLVIQGDVKDDLVEAIPEKWPDVSRDSVHDLGDFKRVQGGGSKSNGNGGKQGSAANPARAKTDILLYDLE